jgi:hypothetical protein
MSAMVEERAEPVLFRDRDDRVRVGVRLEEHSLVRASGPPQELQRDRDENKYAPIVKKLVTNARYDGHKSNSACRRWPASRGPGH